SAAAISMNLSISPTGTWLNVPHAAEGDSRLGGDRSNPPVVHPQPPAHRHLHQPSDTALGLAGLGRCLDDADAPTVADCRFLLWVQISALPDDLLGLGLHLLHRREDEPHLAQGDTTGLLNFLHYVALNSTRCRHIRKTPRTLRTMKPTIAPTRTPHIQATVVSGVPLV